MFQALNNITPQHHNLITYARESSIRMDSKILLLVAGFIVVSVQERMHFNIFLSFFLFFFYFFYLFIYFFLLLLLLLLFFFFFFFFFLILNFYLLCPNYK